MTTTITCPCGREQKTKPGKTVDLKLPPGWKRYDGRIYCRDCLKKAFVLRAVTLPVGSVIEGGEWKDFYAALRVGWRAATDVANWAVTELARADKPRTADQKKMAPMPKVPDIYHGALAVAPDLDPSSVVALLHAVQGKYRTARLKTIWFRKASHPVYRYPVPLPTHNQAWGCIEGDGGRPCISVRVGGQRWTLSLITAKRRRQLGAWRQILSGTAMQGELVLIGQEATGSDHRHAGKARKPGGGRGQSFRVMAKLVAWFPRRERGAQDGVLYLRTDAQSFWTYHIGTDGEVKHVKAEHLRRWQAQHRRHLQAMADDLKHEKRWPADVRRQANERQDLWVRKYKDRIDSWCHESTAMIAKFAERRNVATVVYDDTDQSFVDRFPWHKLREQLKYKLDERSIALEVVAKSDTAGEDDETGEAEAPPAE
jgi:hypothetical protein